MSDMQRILQSPTRFRVVLLQYFGTNDHLPINNSHLVDDSFHTCSRPQGSKGLVPREIYWHPNVVCLFLKESTTRGPLGQFLRSSAKVAQVCHSIQRKLPKQWTRGAWKFLLNYSSLCNTHLRTLIKMWRPPVFIKWLWSHVERSWVIIPLCNRAPKYKPVFSGQFLCTKTQCAYEEKVKGVGWGRKMSLSQQTETTAMLGNMLLEGSTYTYS